MKLLLVGLGRWGRNHLRTWRELGVALRVCDTRPESLDGVPEPGGCDYEALLDEVDAVDIATPAPTHYALVRAALERGKDVLVEKPITDDPAQALELAALAEAEGRILQVGHVFRYAPAARASFELLRSGAIGPVRFVLAHFESFKRPRTDGGLALSDGIHLVDLVGWLLGKRPLRVAATLRDHLGRGMDDLAVLQLDYGDELALLEASCMPPLERRGLQIVGTQGAIVCDLRADRDPVRLFPQHHARSATGAFEAKAQDARVVPVGDEPPLRHELRAFLDACRARRPCPIAADGRAGATAVAVIRCAEAASAAGRTLALDPFLRPGEST